MAGSLNKVMLIGNVGSDPEIRSFSSGDQVVKFSLATSDVWRDKVTNERKERTEWHNIVIYNEALLRVVSQYVKKGTKLYIEGQLQTRKWQDPQTHQDRYITEVVLQKFRGELHLLDRAGGGYSADNRNDAGSFAAARTPAPQDMVARERPNAPRATDSGFDLEDEVPF